MDDMVRQLERREEKPQSYERKSLTAHNYFYLLCKVLKFYFFVYFGRKAWMPCGWLSLLQKKKDERRRR